MITRSFQRLFSFSGEIGNLDINLRNKILICLKLSYRKDDPSSEEIAMKNYVFRSFAVCLALGLTVVFAVAQKDTISAAAGDRYIVSAKAGGVNYVEGTVGVVRKSGTSGLLLKGDSLEAGDRVSTGATGKAEILLNPGSFLRLGGMSAFEFNTTSLDDLELRLDSGSAILEVYAADEFKVNVKTPSATYSLVKSGIFRIDISGDKTSTLKVWKGIATVGSDNTVKAGRTVTANETADVAIMKFDRDQKDPLDEWSKTRSKTLAQQTVSLRQRDIRTPLMRGFLGGNWNFLNSFGLWIYNPFMGGYSFMPFGYGWSSPYGYGYGDGIGWWWQQMNYPMYLPTNPGGNGTGTGTGTGTGPATNGNVRTAVRNPRFPSSSTNDGNSPSAPAAIPPFLRIEQRNAAGIRNGSGRDDTSNSGGTYSPTYSTQSGSSAPPPSISTSDSGGAAHKPPRGIGPQ
jgi:hypothetical protein